MSQSELRPSRLADFVGKQALKDSLRVYIDSAVKRGVALDHCLFYGPAGTGKTTLAMLIAKEMAGRLRIVQGPNLQKPVDVMTLLSVTVKNDFLFIDELHSMHPSCAELLYSAMEDNVMDVVLGKEFDAKTVRIKVAPFTVVGATTLLGKLPDALESRFGIVYKLELYSNEEIEQIVDRTCEILGLSLDQAARSVVAANAKGVPRAANRLVKRIADYFSVGKTDVQEILREMQASSSGLDPVDCKYLQALADAKGLPVGLKALCTSLDEDVRSVEGRIEPYLLKHGLIAKTARGRRITDLGQAELSRINAAAKSYNHQRCFLCSN